MLQHDAHRQQKPYWDIRLYQPTTRIDARLDQIERRKRMPYPEAVFFLFSTLVVKCWFLLDLAHSYTPLNLLA